MNIKEIMWAFGKHFECRVVRYSKDNVFKFFMGQEWYSVEDTGTFYLLTLNKLPFVTLSFDAIVEGDDSLTLLLEGHVVLEVRVS